MTNTELQVKHTCCKPMFRGYGYNSRPCGKTAKFDRDGKHYCGTHDPVTIAEKEAIKSAARHAEWAAKDAARDASLAKRLEIERRADCYTELLEALQDMVKQFTKTPSTLADTNARLKAHKAIAKALGEQA